MATKSINAAGLDLIKSFEGLATEAYVDPVGILTIGYGHIENVKAGDKISPQQADEMLMHDLTTYENGVAKLVKVAINDNEFSALVSLAYNIGLGNLGGSTALKRLNAGDIIGAADAIEWWNKGKVNGKLYVLPGLARRRAAEKALFLRPEADGPATTLGTSGRVAPNSGEAPDRRENLTSSRTIQGGAVAGTAAAAGGAGALTQALSGGKTETQTTTTTTPSTETTPPATAPPSASPTPSTTQTTTSTGQPDAVHEVGGWFADHPWIYTVLFALIVLGVIYVIAARVDDWNKGRR